VLFPVGVNVWQSMIDKLNISTRITLEYAT